MMATKSKEIYKKKKDGTLGFVGYLPTEDVSSRVDEAESSIKDIKDKYVTKTEANNSFAGATATKEALEGLNEATGNNATAINNIKSALAKKQSKLTPGKGISINTTTNEISVNDGAFATTDYVIENFVGNQTYEQDKDGLEQDIGGLASRVTSNESSINNLNTAVADRYTKAESDLAYVHAGALRYSEIKTSYIGSVEGGTGSSPYGNSWDALIRIEHRNGGPADGPNYKTEIITNLVGHGDLLWRKTVGNPNAFGEWKTLIDSSNLDSFLTKQRLTSDLGFGTYQPNITWGSMTSGYAPIWGSDNPYGGGIHFAEKDGQTSMQINGTFRQREGQYEVIDTSTIGSQSVAYADKAGYANSSNTAAICESTALLTAEGTNLGAKIQSQYTSGTPGGSVTYHPATWYVLGNDGDTYNFSKMITTDNFGTNLTEALKNTKIEYSTRSDYATFLDNGNNDSTSISISYDNENTTSLIYTSYPKLTINSVTGYGVLEGNVYNQGTFQLAVSGKSNGTIFIRSVEKGGSAPSWAKLLIDDDVINSLDSDIINRPLSAYQGKVLSGKIASIHTLPSWVTDYGFKNSSSMYLTNFFAGTYYKQTSYSSGGDYMLDISIIGASFGRGSWYATASPCGVNGSTGDWSTQFTVTCSILNSSTIRVWFHCLNGSNSSSSAKLYCNVVAIKYY